jgi:hypothetical protein
VFASGFQVFHLRFKVFYSSGFFANCFRLLGIPSGELSDFSAAAQVGLSLACRIKNDIAITIINSRTSPIFLFLFTAFILTIHL